MDLDSYVKVREGALRDEYYKYLDSHPELQQILTDFLTALVVHTPDDVYAFAAEHDQYPDTGEHFVAGETLIHPAHLDAAVRKFLHPARTDSDAQAALFGLEEKAAEKALCTLGASVSRVVFAQYQKERQLRGYGRTSWGVAQAELRTAEKEVQSLRSEVQRLKAQLRNRRRINNSKSPSASRPRSSVAMHRETHSSRQQRTQQPFGKAIKRYSPARVAQDYFVSKWDKLNIGTVVPGAGGGGGRVAKIHNDSIESENSPWIKNYPNDSAEAATNTSGGATSTSFPGRTSRTPLPQKKEHLRGQMGDVLREFSPEMQK
eukprot:g13777.t1